MANNKRFTHGKHVTINGATILQNKLAGAPVVVGGISGVLVDDAGAVGTGVIDREGVYALSVKGVSSTGNSAVAVGDPLYFVEADTPKVSKKASGGPLFGYALGVITGGATGTINVLLTGGASSSEDARLDAVETSITGFATTEDLGDVGDLTTTATDAVGAIEEVKAVAEAALVAPEAALFIADLDETVAAADIDDDGTIAGVEVAAAMSAQNIAINALKDVLVGAGLMAAS
jgi:hypothetical protein